MSDPRPSAGAVDDRHHKRHLSFDPASSARLDRLAEAFGRPPSHVVCLALDLQETANNRLARHGIREPMQALRSVFDLLRPRLGDDAELVEIFERALRDIDERLGTSPPASRVR